MSPIANRTLREQLARVQAELDEARAMVRSYNPSRPPEQVSAAWIHEILRVRRRRDEFFGNIFSDPAWDLLLALYGAELANERTTITQASKLAGVKPSTGLRWSFVLEEKGLVTRDPDGEDGRSVLVKLTSRARKGMEHYFSADQAETAGL